MNICVKCGFSCKAKCPFTETAEGLLCARCNKLEESFELKMELKKTVCHFGAGAAKAESQYANFVKSYADSIDANVISFGLDCNFFQAADEIKRAHFVFIWNGMQGKSPLAKALCEARGIPHIFFEWGMLPQKETFFLDPKGFCGDSILNSHLSWVTENDMKNLYKKRAELQEKYPIRDEGYVLVPLQIECDSQVLYYSNYKTMNDFIEQVELLYPKAEKIIVRPHPKGGKNKITKRAIVSSDGDFLEVASKASVIVGITSTCLYEAGILGKPVVALGNHPLRKHNFLEHDKVLAGALALTVERTGTPNLILDRFNLKPI